MRVNDADNVRLTAEARQRALYLKTLKERKIAYGHQLIDMRALAARNRGVKGGKQYKDEIWALKQGIYLAQIELTACTQALDSLKAQLRRRLMLDETELSKLIDP